MPAVRCRCRVLQDSGRHAGRRHWETVLREPARRFLLLEKKTVTE